MHPFIVIIIGLAIALAIERIFPHRNLPQKANWFARAIIANGVQLLIVIIGSYTWDVWLEGPSIFKLPWSPLCNAIFVYLVHTWVFYWYHLLRHNNNFLWLVTHQFHHSPVRIEAITSFYKHPIEITTNSWIMTVITCPILGLDYQTNAWFIIFAAFSEFFYHFNVETPHWVGYFIQRPEMHLAHHAEDRQFTWNYSDLPLWDILGGTWFNPTKEQAKKIKTGFSKDRENEVIPMLLFQNVLPEKPKKLPANLTKAIIISLLFLLGSLNMIGLVFQSPQIKAIAFVSCSSPLPFVFSAYEKIETFSTSLEVNATFKNGTNGRLMIDHKLYSKLRGPYNRKNVIGAIFSHGPFFKDPNMIKIRDQILNWGFCKGYLLNEFEINDPLEKMTINVKSKTIGNENKKWAIDIKCE